MEDNTKDKILVIDYEFWDKDITKGGLYEDIQVRHKTKHNFSQTPAKNRRQARGILYLWKTRNRKNLLRYLLLITTGLDKIEQNIYKYFEFKYTRLTGENLLFYESRRNLLEHGRKLHFRFGRNSKKIRQKLKDRYATLCLVEPVKKEKKNSIINNARMERVANVD